MLKLLKMTVYIIFPVDLNIKDVFVSESVENPWERALTERQKVPYYVKYAYHII